MEIISSGASGCVGNDSGAQPIVSALLRGLLSSSLIVVFAQSSLLVLDLRVEVQGGSRTLDSGHLQPLYGWGHSLAEALHTPTKSHCRGCCPGSSMVRGALGPGVGGGMGRGVGCGLEAAIGRWLRWAGTPSAYLQAYCIRP